MSKIYKHDGSVATALIQERGTELVSGQLYNSGASDIWVQLHNKNGLVLNGETAILPIALPAGAVLVLDRIFTRNAFAFSEGLAIGISSTYGTYTAYGTPSEVKGVIIFE